MPTLFSYDRFSEVSVADDMANMESARSLVETLEITRAVRDSVVDGQRVQYGQYMAILDGKLAALAGSPDAALREGLPNSGANEDSIISLYWGGGATEEQAAELQAELEDKYRGARVDVYEGGQPHYRYLVSVE